MAQATIVIVGDELLTGERVESNSSHIARTLGEAGIAVKRIITVGDELEEITSAIDVGLGDCQLVLLSGGLGPTSDDRTKDALCRYFAVQLEFHPQILDDIRNRFAERGMEMPQVNREQAYQPTGATLLDNPLGSARGILMVDERSGCIVSALPGVPPEMKAMLADSLLPLLKEKGLASPPPAQRELRVVGLPESGVAETLAPLEERHASHPHFAIAYYPHQIEVLVRLKAPGLEAEKGASFLDALEEEARRLLGDHIFGGGEDDLAEVVGKMLKEKKATLAVAESLSGGLLSQRITAVPGASDYYRGGVVAYSNQVKVELLGVREETRETVGAVSEEVAIQMALGAASTFHAEYALSTTGIAGPTGATAEKPVGLVYIACCRREDVRAYGHIFTGGRHMVMRRTAQTALDILRLTLLHDRFPEKRKGEMT